MQLPNTTPPRSYHRFLETTAARRAEPWQREVLGRLRYGSDPGVETYLSLLRDMAPEIFRATQST